MISIIGSRDGSRSAAAIIAAAVLLAGCGGRPAAPPEPQKVLAVRPDESPVSVELKDRDDLRGIAVGMPVDVLVLPTGRGGPVLIVSGRVIALSERDRTAVVAVSRKDSGALTERVKEGGRPMLAVRPDPGPSAHAGPSSRDRPR